MNIPIYNPEGEQVDTLSLPENVYHVDGRVSRGEKVWYKGVGVPYLSHYVQLPTEGYEVVEQSNVFYLGYEVRKRCFKDKFGIFQERHQSHFTDWIGACGEKEIQIVENEWELGFERSGIRVHEFKPIAEGQYYLICDYPYGRNSYLGPGQKPEKLYNLLEYMVKEDWNFPWDKASITDVLYNGTVTDIADVFTSKELKHKVGTVYSVLYSMGTLDRSAYEHFCKRYGLNYESHMSYVLNGLQLLSLWGVDITPLMCDNIPDTYRNIVKNYLVLGKNCGYCGVGSCSPEADPNKTWGEYIREQYMLQVSTL